VGKDKDKIQDDAQSRCSLARLVGWAATRTKTEVIVRIVILITRRETRC
jgi:hypothetical protein